MQAVISNFDDTQNCTIFIDYQALFVPPLMTTPKKDTDESKPDFSARLKELNAQYGQYQLLELIDTLSLDHLKHNYVSCMLNGIDNQTSYVQEALKELTLKAQESEAFAPSSYQYSGILLQSQLDKAKTPLASLKLLTKMQDGSCSSLVSYTNYIFLYGIREIGRLGLLNHPNLSEPILPTKAALNGNTVVSWKEKSADESLSGDLLLNDIDLLFDTLVESNHKLGKTITKQDSLALLVSSTHYKLLAPHITKLQEQFAKLLIIESPELAKSSKEKLVLVVLQNAQGEPCFISQTPSYSISPFYHTMEPDDISKYQWDLSGSSPAMQILNPSFIARMTGI